MQKIIVTILAVCIMQYVTGQKNNIVKCWLWKPKQGQEQNFEDGYNKHFAWHKQNGDTAVWYCWQFKTGFRHGQFLDVSFNSWKDFDISFKPDEDNADYQLNLIPFGDLQNSFKLAYLEDLSFKDTVGLHSNYMRLLTISVTDISTALKIIEKLKKNYASNSLCKNFLVFKMIDGGTINQIFLMLGFNNYAEYGKSENFQEEINSIEKLLKTNGIVEITSETLSYRPDLFIIQK